MKIKFIGTGMSASKDRAISSFLINDEILFDIGAGTNRRLQEIGVGDTAIKTLIISHFHGDHVSDLPVWLLRRTIRTNNSEKLTIITPQNGRQQIIDAVNFAHFPLFEQDNIEESTNTEIIELDNNSTRLGDVEVSAYKVDHVPDLACNGYVVAIGGKAVGLSGDAVRCDGLDKIVEASDVVLLDANTVEPHPVHLGAREAINYAEQYPEKEFYLIHRSDYEINDLPKNVFMPDDGEEIEL